MKGIVEYINESILEVKFEMPEWYVEKVQKVEKKLLAAVKDTKVGKGKFARFAEAGDLIEFLVDAVVDTWPELMKDNGPELSSQEELDDSLEYDLIDNWLSSDEVVDKEHADEDYSSDDVVKNYKKLGGWDAWYKLATGNTWE